MKKQKKRINKSLRSFKFKGALETGKVLSVKDGVAKVSGLFGILCCEMVNLGINYVKGMVLSLEYNTVSVVIFGNDTSLKQGDLVYRSFLMMNCSFILSNKWLIKKEDLSGDRSKDETQIAIL
jgi:F0F1-type ATP synthase alpha subunit